MIKLPTDEFKYKLVDDWFAERPQCTIKELMDRYEKEILRINEPAKPAFQDGINYCSKDGDGIWNQSDKKPYYTPACGWWSTKDGVMYDVAESKQILWLEHINGNRPPSESLICLEDYK